MSLTVLMANPAVRVPIDDLHERYYIKAGSRWPWSFTRKKTDKIQSCTFPQFLGYAAGLLLREGHNVQVIDGVALDLPDEEFYSRVKGIRPDLIVVETATHSIDYDLEICKQLKRQNPRAKLLLCGAHVTTCGKEIIEKNEFIDFVVRGEFEFVIKQVAQLIEEPKPDYASIEGLGFRDGKGVFVSEKKAFIDDINDLPSPAFELFPCNDAPDLLIYGDGVCSYRPAVTLHASRGCPFMCDFCMWNIVMYDNKKYRMFKPERIVDEMELVKYKYGAKEVWFDDDDFCVNKKHVLALCAEIKKRKLKMHWSVMGDAMVTDEEMMREMASAGCYFMKFGVESGNKNVLKEIGKPLDPKKAIQVAQWGRKYGIYTHATFIFGLSGETEESMQDTLDLAKKIKFDTAQMSIGTPIPGTRFYEKMKAKGYLNTSEAAKYDGTHTYAVTSQALKPEQVERFRKKAIRTVVANKALDPIWWKRYLKRNYTVYQNYGGQKVFEPIRALLSL